MAPSRGPAHSSPLALHNGLLLLPLVLVLLLSRPQVHAHATQCFLAALSNDMWLLSTLSGLPCSGLDLRRPAPFCAYMAHL